MATRDHQRQRVYDWEDQVVAPRDQTHIPFKDAQGMVNAIWAEMGLRYPPRVRPLPPQNRRSTADANRFEVRLRPMCPSWCLLHELAHSMTCDIDGRSDGHGTAYVGIYVQLLVRYLRLDKSWLLATLRDAGIEVDVKAVPLFVGESAR